MAKVKLDGFECEKCEYKWVPRETTEDEPIICPNCKNPYWNRPIKFGEKSK